MEQERTESQAIIDSLKADSSETAEASTLKSEVDNLQNQITQKDKEMNKYKNEHALQDEQIVLCTEESKHLKEMLALKEKELEKVTLEKRAALDEKRAALDELRRQAVKPAKRPLLEIHNITDSPNTPSDQDDPVRYFLSPDNFYEAAGFFVTNCKCMEESTSAHVHLETYLSLNNDPSIYKQKTCCLCCV